MDQKLWSYCHYHPIFSKWQNIGTFFMNPPGYPNKPARSTWNTIASLDYHIPKLVGVFMQSVTCTLLDYPSSSDSTAWLSIHTMEILVFLRPFCRKMSDYFTKGHQCTRLEASKQVKTWKVLQVVVLSHVCFPRTAATYQVSFIQLCSRCCRLPGH